MSCPTCGAPASEGASACSTCGHLFATTNQAPMRQARPIGVTVLAVLATIGAVFAALGGLAFLVGGSVLGAAMGSMGGDAAAGGAAGALIGGFVSIFFFLAAVVSGLVAWGLWSGMAWAWVVTLVLQGLNALSGLWSLVEGEASAIFGLAIAGLIVWYLLRPEVRTYFRMG